MGLLLKRQKFAAAALLLGISAFVSRLMGLARDKIISWQFGASGEADMYFAAFVVPDIINYLLAGGFMSITLIPLLAKGFESDSNDTWRFFSCVLGWMCAGSILLTLTGELWAESLAALVAPGFKEGQILRLAMFMRIILPGQVFFLSGACFTALLFLRRQFAIPALTPIIYNGLIIICGVISAWLWPEAGMTGYCAGVLLGAFSGAFLLPYVAAAKTELHFEPVLYHPLLKKFLIIALPLMLGQTVVMLDEQFLRIFGSLLPEGNVSLLNYARRIEQVPVALMGQALAVASYPFLVRYLAKNELDKFHASLNKALGDGLELVIPTAALMIVCAMPILTIIFQGGRFDEAATLACSPLTRIMLASTPLWIIYMTLVRGYYAFEDSLTPAITGTILTLCFVPLYRYLAVPFGAPGIALLSSLSILAYVIWLMAIWRHRHGPETFRGLGLVVFKSLCCTLPAAAIALTLNQYLQEFFFPPTFPGACVMLCLVSAAFALVFLPLALLINPRLPQKILAFVKRQK